MICRQCLRGRAAAAAGSRSTLVLVPRRALSLSRARRSAAAAGPPPPFPNPAATPAPPPPPADQPFGTPTGASPLKVPTRPKSSCPAGTVLAGLNYHKGQDDPVALPDDQYPAGLWQILDRREKDELDDGGDMFSKSKKQRKLAAKKTRLREEAAIESGDVEVLAPKIPLSHQSVNLPGADGGTVADNVRADDAREELRQAMRKERLNHIREQNYLSTL